MKYPLIAAFSLITAFHTPHALAQSTQNNSISIQTQSQLVPFHVELADTNEKLQNGLMFRSYLKPKHGMLFDFRRSQRIAMWMKNTFIPLDMIFFDDRGYVVALIRNTQPLSLKTLDPGVPARAVLEINAGEALNFNIRVGNLASHPIFHLKPHSPTR